MSDYNRTIIFADKDALLAGDPNKVIRGVEVDVELDLAQGAVNSKFDTNDLATTPQAIEGTSADTLISPLTMHNWHNDYLSVNPAPVTEDFVQKTGDTMTGGLDMIGADIRIMVPGATEEDPDISRIETYTETDVGIQRSGLAFYDVDGNDEDDDALIDIRTETNGTGVDFKSAIIQKPAVLGSTSGFFYTGLYAFSKIEQAAGHAQYAFQGETADDRRAWFGTGWSGGNNSVQGTSGIQLYINRPIAGNADFVDLTVAGARKFNIDFEGNVDIANGATFSVDGVPVSGGGVEEAPVNGSEYVRQDAAWVVNSGAAGDFLPRDGSLPMVGSLNLHNMQSGPYTQTWWEDAGLTRRMEFEIQPEVGGVSPNRAQLRMFDIDGTFGPEDHLVSIRTDSDNTGNTLKSGIVLQPGLAGSNSGHDYTGIFGFSKISNTLGYAQYAFQGTSEGDRRAWFGSSWAFGPNEPTGRGLQGLQLYLDRPTRGTNNIIDMYYGGIYSNVGATPGTRTLQVSPDGRIDAASGIRAGTVDIATNLWDVNGGPGLEMGAVLDGSDAGLIRAYNRSTTTFLDMFFDADQIHFRTTGSRDDLTEATVRIWNNPDTNTEDEFALFAKTQFRQYSDAGGTLRAVETIGSNSSSNGLRVFTTAGGESAITIAADVGGTSFINLKSGTYQIDGVNIDNKYLAVGAKANDSNKLDGLDSTQFFRTDATEETFGVVTNHNTWTFNAAVHTNGNLRVNQNMVAKGPIYPDGGILCRFGSVSGGLHQIFYWDSGVTPAGSIATTSANTTAYATSSDYRRKENVVDLDTAPAVQLLKDYHVRKWDWKEGGGQGIGFFAHEVSEFVDDAVVGTKDGATMQGVDYSKLVPLLWAQNQELLERLEALEP